jgi:glycosyltransferase involved in cell wall biosynthesis
MTRRLKVLISAYGCEPEQGSEAGAGWGWSMQIARFHEVWVITRANNREAIERALTKEPTPNVHWVYFDLPDWWRFWKKGQRGIRLYYYLWQIGSYCIGRRLHDRVGFDLAHHLTFGTYWMPSFLALLPIPFIWGPVGGGESSPKPLFKTFSLKGKAYECLRDIARWRGEQDPFVRMTARRARLALATSPETEKRLKKLGCPQVRIFPQSGISYKEVPSLRAVPLHNGNPFRLVSIGRLLHWKGFHLGLKAFAQLHQEFPDSEYYLIGDGPERRNLESLAEKFRIAGKVRFWGNLPRQRVMEKLLECDALVHPSLHDSSPWVCLEAMAVGRPVICLDLGGSGLQVTNETGVKVPAITPVQVVHDLAKAMYRLAQEPGLRACMSEAGQKRIAEEFLWDKKGEWMNTVYTTLCKPRSE